MKIMGKIVVYGPDSELDVSFDRARRDEYGHAKKFLGLTRKCTEVSAKFRNGTRSFL